MVRSLSIGQLSRTTAIWDTPGEIGYAQKLERCSVCFRLSRE